jgi:hypothetical protein
VGKHLSSMFEAWVPSLATTKKKKLKKRRYGEGKRRKVDIKCMVIQMVKNINHSFQIPQSQYGSC